MRGVAVKWLAYDPSVSDRYGARPVYGFLTPSGVAQTFALLCYMRESFEKHMDVVVVKIAADDTETEYRYTVDVVHEPTFYARRI